MVYEETIAADQHGRIIEECGIMLLINQIRLKIDEDESLLKQKIEKKLKHPIRSFQIHRKSLDARKQPVYVYSVLVEIDDEDRYLGKDITKFQKTVLRAQYRKRNKICIIVGYGPSGIFSAYRLMEAGYDVKVFEKGKRISQREKDVDLLFKKGILNEKSNVQFGEGGAGTFSDAKLTTRIKDPMIEYILDILVEHGAKDSIRYQQHAHIGTDEIRKIISSITDDLISKGCEFHFEEEMIELLLDKNHKVTGIRTDRNDYDCDFLLLGIGHSAYQTIQILKKQNVYIEKKDISLGFRVEHPQSLINQRQTKGLIDSANEYFLRYKGEKGVYSFCMCPGGMVIPAMSEKETIVTNGMSYSDRGSGIANSAILIQMPKEEFADGYEYLHEIEKKAYTYSRSYRVLSQNISDFIKGELHELIFSSTYPLGSILYDFNDLFTENDARILKEAILDFDRKIPGFIEQGIMTGPETRSSCPIRIRRNENCESINTEHLYPMGEGAGYGGGIMSCALDGIRCANAILLKYE